MSAHLAGGVVGVLGQLGVHAIQADRVSDVAHGEAGLVQDGDDALVRLLYQVHNDLVVEVVDLDANGGQESSVRLTLLPSLHSCDSCTNPPKNCLV